MAGGKMASVSKEEVLEKLDLRAFYASELPSWRQSGREASASCPFHEDRRPSFSVNLETGLWRCHAGCGGGDVFAFVMQRYGLTFPQALRKLQNGGIENMRVIRLYEWTDAAGHIAFHMRLDGDPKFVWAQDREGQRRGLGDCTPTLYHWASLSEATEIIVVEGERDVETVSRLLIDGGMNTLRATCTPHGAQSVKPEYLVALHGKTRVWISGDNDEAGQGYAREVARQLQGTVQTLWDLKVPEGFKDWTDWAEDDMAEGRPEAFKQLLFNAAPLSLIPSSLDVPWRSASQILETPVIETEWLIDGMLPKGAVILLSGREGSMKSWVVMRLAHAVAEGHPWLGRACQHGPVLYLDGEMPPALLQKRLRLGIGGSQHLHIWSWADQGTFPVHLEGSHLIEAARSHSLIVVDTLRRFMSGFQENSADDMAKVSQMLRELTRYGATVLVLHHAPKDVEKRGYRGSTELGAGVDITMSLEKKQQGGLVALHLSTEKTRFGGSPKVELVVRGSHENPEFQDRTENSNEPGEQMVKLRELIEELTKTLGQSPNQGQIFEVAHQQGLWSKERIRTLLKNGERIYWQSHKSGTSKVYVPLFVLSVPIEQEPKKKEDEEQRGTSEALSVQSGGARDSQIDKETDSHVMTRISAEAGDELLTSIRQDRRH